MHSDLIPTNSLRTKFLPSLKRQMQHATLPHHKSLGFCMTEQAVRKAIQVQAKPILKWAGGKTQMLGDLLPKVPAYNFQSFL